MAFRLGYKKDGRGLLGACGRRDRFDFVFGKRRSLWNKSPRRSFSPDALVQLLERGNDGADNFDSTDMTFRVYECKCN
ncbi:MAG: hypothetical protein JW959_00660 [Pirellulales bacterium]|nr:hypothetical protein [Pirellulales bacterium]